MKDWHAQEGTPFDEPLLTMTIPWPADPRIAMYALTAAGAIAAGRGLNTQELPQALTYLLNLCEELDWDAIQRNIDIHTELIPTLRASLARLSDRIP